MHLVIQLEDIKIPSINAKYNWNPKAKRLFINKSYQDFKNLLKASCKRVSVRAPYAVEIHITSYNDIDNAVKAILDSLDNVIDNDRDVEELHVFKTPNKRGRSGALKVYVSSLGF